ncbi:MAG: hypothetical protein IJB29_00490 [Mailhella sp.]|nr:hypothetical protein [Mailhella sp.]
MRSFRFSFLSFAVMLFAALALTGCFAKQDVRLLYNTQALEAAPSATAPRIVVVQFDDTRNTPHIGVRKDGTAFDTSSSVAGWATQAMADELARRGAQVSVALSMAQAQLNQPQYIVGGTVERAWLTEKGMTSYQAEIRVQTRLISKGQSPVTRTFTAQQEKTGLPGMKLAEDTLSGALADALSGAASAILGNLR